MSKAPITPVGLSCAQASSAPPAPPGRAPGAERPRLPKPGGTGPAHAGSWGEGGLVRGGAPPAPDPQPQGLQSPRISPLRQPPSPGDTNPQRSGRGRVTRRGPGAKTAEACRAPGPEARCSRLPRRRLLQPGAASPAAPEASSRRSPRPAVTGGRWRGSRGGAGGIQSPSDPAGERGRARRRPESQASAGACAARRARVRISGESA